MSTSVECAPCTRLRHSAADGAGDAIVARPTCHPNRSPSMTTAMPSIETPDATGHFGPYGGRFVPEALVAALDELTDAFHAAQADPAFGEELNRLLRDYTGRPSPLTDVPRFGAEAGGARILLKREDLNHTGSHKINNVLGQALLTQRIG